MVLKYNVRNDLFCQTVWGFLIIFTKPVYMGTKKLSFQKEKKKKKAAFLVLIYPPQTIKWFRLFNAHNFNHQLIFL